MVPSLLVAFSALISAPAILVAGFLKQIHNRELDKEKGLTPSKTTGSQVFLKGTKVWRRAFSRLSNTFYCHYCFICWNGAVKTRRLEVVAIILRKSTLLFSNYNQNVSGLIMLKGGGGDFVGDDFLRQNDARGFCSFFPLHVENCFLVIDVVFLHQLTSDISPFFQ